MFREAFVREGFDFDFMYDWNVKKANLAKRLQENRPQPQNQTTMQTQGNDYTNNNKTPVQNINNNNNNQKRERGESSGLNTQNDPRNNTNKKQQ